MRGSWLLILIAMTALVRGCWAESVDIVAPSDISFGVIDIASNCAGSPSPSTISFSDAQLLPGKALRISVIAVQDSFTSTGGSPISCTGVSWSIGNATGGSGASGRLSNTIYTTVYESSPNPSSGSVDINWSLDPCATGVFAGAHVLVLRWKLESVGG